MAERLTRALSVYDPAMADTLREVERFTTPLILSFVQQLVTGEVPKDREGGAIMHLLAIACGHQVLQKQNDLAPDDDGDARYDMQKQTAEFCEAVAAAFGHDNSMFNLLGPIAAATSAVNYGVHLACLKAMRMIDRDDQLDLEPKPVVGPAPRMGGLTMLDADHPAWSALRRLIDDREKKLKLALDARDATIRHLKGAPDPTFQTEAAAAIRGLASLMKGVTPDCSCESCAKKRAAQAFIEKWGV